VTVDDPGTTPDERLMARYVDGDARAFDELFRRYERRAFVFFERRTGCSERARDLYQELFLRVHRARASYDPSRPFSPWFFQIARRLAVDDRRRSLRAREVALGEREPVATGPDAERARLGSERATHVLDRLSAQERRVLVAAKVEGAGYAELARELGLSVAAVKKLASRAMHRLRAGEQGVTCLTSAPPNRFAKASARPS
jgi:RNA polymerase sigma-70 factor (ECF subfamily)